MSLILEALRKSEAERRRGQVPGLHAELPPAAQSARSRRPPWPWLGALVVIALVAATWLGRDLWAPTPPVTDTPERVGSSSTDSTGPADADRAVTNTGRTDAATPVDDLTPPAIEPPSTSPQVDEVIPAAGSPAMPTVAPTDPTAIAQRRPEPAVPPTRDTGTDSRRAGAPAATVAPPTTRPVPRPTEPAAKPPVATAPDATATAVDKSAPLRLSDLAAAERRALPPLQVSMHMWAPTSPERFAIIDGARVNEGDRLGDAVVDEITRDGVVLAWRGRRVHIPIH